MYQLYLHISHASCLIPVNIKQVLCESTMNETKRREIKKDSQQRRRGKQQTDTKKKWWNEKKFHKVEMINFRNLCQTQFRLWVRIISDNCFVNKTTRNRMKNTKTAITPFVRFSKWCLCLIFSLFFHFRSLKWF